MFAWLKGSPEKRLKADYARLMNEAMLLQRRGNMAAFAAKTAEAESISRKLDELKSQG